jgi:CBS domain-containing protein
MTLTAHDIIERKRLRLRDLIDMELALPQATLSRDSTVRDAMRIISEENRGGVVVLDDDRSVVGILSERDIVKNIFLTGADVLDWTVDRIMTVEVLKASEDTRCQTSLTEMIDKKIRNMPVCNASGELVASVEILQVAHVRLAELLEANRKLMDLLAQAASTQSTVGPNECSKTIKEILLTKGLESVIVREGEKNLGFITKDDLLRASHHLSVANAS